MRSTDDTRIETKKVNEQPAKKDWVERTKNMSWDELSEVLSKFDGFILGEKIKEITLMNPKKIKFILERRS